MVLSIATGRQLGARPHAVFNSRTRRNRRIGRSELAGLLKHRATVVDSRWAALPASAETQTSRRVGRVFLEGVFSKEVSGPQGCSSAGGIVVKMATFDPFGLGFWRRGPFNPRHSSGHGRRCADPAPGWLGKRPSGKKKRYAGAKRVVAAVFSRRAGGRERTRVAVGKGWAPRTRKRSYGKLSVGASILFAQAFEDAGFSYFFFCRRDHLLPDVARGTACCQGFKTGDDGDRIAAGGGGFPFRVIAVGRFSPRRLNDIPRPCLEARRAKKLEGAHRLARAAL